MTTRYQITQWRKRLERKGWIGLKRAPAPRGELIEYHVISRGWLYSGRCELSDYSPSDWAIEGSLVCMLERRHGIVDGVWRWASPGAGPKGGIVRWYQAVLNNAPAWPGPADRNRPRDYDDHDHDGAHHPRSL